MSSTAERAKTGQSSPLELLEASLKSGGYEVLGNPIMYTERDGIYAKAHVFAHDDDWHSTYRISNGQVSQVTDFEYWRVEQKHKSKEI